MLKTLTIQLDKKTSVTNILVGIKEKLGTEHPNVESSCLDVMMDSLTLMRNRLTVAGELASNWSASTHKAEFIEFMETYNDFDLYLGCR